MARLKNILERRLWPLDALLVLCLFALTFLERPHWCAARGASVTADCQEDVFGNRYHVLQLWGYAADGVFLWSTVVLLYFNAKLYLLYSALKAAHARTLFESERKMRLALLSLLNALHLLCHFLQRDAVLAADVPTVVKALALVVIVDWMYRAARRMLLALRTFYELLLFLLLDWVFLAALLQVAFLPRPDYHDDARFFSFNFSDYLSSLFSVFVLFTGASAPQIALPAHHARGAAPLLLAAVALHNVLALALLVGLAYLKLKQALAHEVAALLRDPRRVLVFRKLRDFPHVSTPLLRRLLLLHAATRDPARVDVGPALRDTAAAAAADPARAPTRASQYIFGVLKGLKSYELLYALVDLVLVCFSLFVVHARAPHRYHYFLFSVLLASVSVLDFLHHSFFHDIWNVDRTWKTLLDTLLSALVIVLAFVVVSDAGATPALLKCWALACALKGFRAFVLAFRFDRAGMRANVLRPLLSYFAEVLLQLALLFFVAAALGASLLGGRINSFTVDGYNRQTGAALQPGPLNLNSLPNALLFFFGVLLGHDWPALANVAVFDRRGAVGTSAVVARFLFAAFVLYARFILLNSLIAFVVEILYAHSAAAQRAKTEAGEADQVLEFMEEDLISGINKPLKE